MSSSVPFADITKSTTARFNLVGLAPSALFAVTIGLLIASDAFSGVPSMRLLVLHLKDVNVLTTSILLLIGFSVTLVFHPFQLLLVRILEGYWDQIPVLRKMQFIGIEINRRRRANLLAAREDAASLVARLYPARARDFLPTRLGNVLRAAERRAGQNHGFTRPVEMLPRIYPYLSPWLSEALGDARDELDIACRMSVVLWILAAVTGAIFVADGAVPASDGSILAVPAAAAFLGVVSYRAAVQSAQAYGRYLFYVFDLHRRDLIRALGYEPPQSPKEEKELIQALTEWLVQGSSPPVSHRERSLQPPSPP